MIVLKYTVQNFCVGGVVVEKNVTLLCFGRRNRNDKKKNAYEFVWGIGRNR